MPIVAISGGFDPIHIGHIDMINHAAEYGDVMVILNSDDWLKRKKGYVFMPYYQRCEVLMNLKAVHGVMRVNDDDGTVCQALRALLPDYFANGGDRTKDNTPELDLCKRLNITPLFNIGGSKVASSSQMVKEAYGQIS